MDPELDELLRRVEAGEALAPAELSRLEAAARRSPTPELRLAVAHALVNADQERAALPLLEALRRDHPGSVQVDLAHARALAGLERWGEAERVLREALRRSPGDPDARKVLAIIAMRRGELARGRRLVDEVIRVDPFDPEAQLLHGELAGGGAAASVVGPVRGALDQEAFAIALLEALRGHELEVTLHEEQLLVRHGRRRVTRLDVESLFARYASHGEDPDVIAGELAGRFAGSRLQLPRTREGLLARVLPVLREASFLERAPGAAHREGPAALVVAYVVEDPELLVHVPEGALEAMRVPLVELDEAAFSRLSERAVDPQVVEVAGGGLHLAPDPTGVWAVAASDGHDAARLLTAVQLDRVEKLLGPPPWRVGLGMRELALICAEADARAVEALCGAPAQPEGIGGRWRIGPSRALERVA